MLLAWGFNRFSCFFAHWQFRIINFIQGDSRLCATVCVFVLSHTKHTPFHVLTSWKNYYYIIILSASDSKANSKRCNHRPLTLGHLNPTFFMCMCVFWHGAYNNNKFQFFTHTHTHIAFKGILLLGFPARFILLFYFRFPGRRTEDSPWAACAQQFMRFTRFC